MKKKFADGGIYTAEMGQPPMDPEMAPPPPRPPNKRPPMKRPMPKKPMAGRPMPKGMQYPDSTPVPDPVTYAKGGSVGSASKRADGCATKGKTKGRMI